VQRQGSGAMMRIVRDFFDYFSPAQNDVNFNRRNGIFIDMKGSIDLVVS
jgi:lipase chaperone LimK